MDIKQIMDRFNSMPYQKKMDELRSEANNLRTIANNLYTQASKYESEANKLVELVNKEGDSVANSLDNEYPEWRQVIVQHIQNQELFERIDKAIKR